MQTKAFWPRAALLATLGATALLASGCGTSFRQYLHNGLKVGPNYCPPAASVAPQWIDADDQRLRSESDDLGRWWHVFNDPTLDELIDCAYQQNLTLRQAGYRVLAARAQLRIAEGSLFPQSQRMTGDYQRAAISSETANDPLNFGIPGITRFFSQWDLGFNLAWELDFWGRFRRALESDCASLNASVANYDDVLVTLLADVATSYALLRTYQLRLEYARENISLQRVAQRITQAGYEAGTVNKIDMLQARSVVKQTEAQVEELEIGLRQSGNQLCILLGIPPEDLLPRLGQGSIPAAPPEVAVGIPADLLCRRPDVRRAERQAAAQSAAIGVAMSELYPHIAVTGTIGLSSEQSGDLFNAQAMNGAVGPSFQWNILNYGRIWNNVCLQDARFRELVTAYQNSVLRAAQDVENGLVTFLRAQRSAEIRASAANDIREAVKIALYQYKEGKVLFTQVTQLELALVAEQEALARARNEAVAGLIQVYRALGGGWQIRLSSPAEP